ncbi:MAG: hemerythrin [Deltaproteobacteria bacterium HGW-Deltaproteobacteria-8]|jgi:hemerythrin|nr:MAG: hemerythrin [Deltaproteobacteria bacterium HGW-Deltaproteobacteria-8]
MLGLIWSSKLETGIAEIDAQHRKLVDIGNRVIEAVQEKLGTLCVDEIVKELREYTVVHFQEEEARMESLHYPDCEAHHVEHERLKNQVKQWQREIYTKEMVDASEVLAFLRGWLIDHIMHSDMAFKAWLAGNATCTLKEGKTVTKCSRS